MTRFKGLAICGAIAVTVALLIACGNDGPTVPTQTSRLDSAGALFGTLPAISYATTVTPPPPTPTPIPEDEEEGGSPNGERNGFYFAKGVLLSSDGNCPGCLLKVRGAKVRVPQSARLERRASNGSISSITMEELVALLAPGLPLDTKSIPGGSEHSAVRVRVERSVRTAGTINKSSADVKAQGTFTLSGNGSTIRFRLSDEASVQSFSAGARVLVSGSLPGNFSTGNPVLVAGLVAKDE